MIAHIVESFKSILYKEKSVFFDGFKSKSEKKLALCIGFSEWKRGYIKEYLHHYSPFFTNHRTPTWKLIKLLDTIEQDFDVFIWSYQESAGLLQYFKKNDIPVTRVEDGFIRSIGLGLFETKPLSLAFDKRGLYFNTGTISDLEYILLHHAQHYDVRQLERAKELIRKITSKGISKYNFKKIDKKIEYLPKDKKIVLVVGQVEDDMSIRYGCSSPMTNIDLLKKAFSENSDAFIIYKPHPDTLTGVRKTVSPLRECQKFCDVIDAEFQLATFIKVADHIYTITSLSGFEALMYGKKVTCLGSPFYSGWGLTDDRDKRDRIVKVKLSLEQIFYAAYIEYPNYILGNIENTISHIEQELNKDE